MKTKRPLLVISISIVFLLGCQLIAQAPVNNSDTIQTQNPTAVLTPTEVPTPTDVNIEPTTIPVVEIADDHGVPMMLVPAGNFAMGNGSSGREGPIHQVYLDAFYMDKYEVTNLLYKACVDVGGCDEPHRLYSYSRPSYFGNPEYDDYPVIAVDWFQAKTYCEWRGASLPTEAQWEKAARGVDERKYPWGEEPSCERANSRAPTDSKYCVGDTVAVGSYENGVSPYGIYDMAGNVWEWVADWYSETYYQTSPLSNPKGPESDPHHVLRGGAWNDHFDTLRVSYRVHLVANEYHSVGFRCAQSANP